MISIKVAVNEGKAICGVTVSGHANLAPKGQDIVCAGVSSLVQTAALGVKRHLRRKIILEVSEGYLCLELKDVPDELTEAVLQTMVIGLKEIAKIYPDSVQIVEHRR